MHIHNQRAQVQNEQQGFINENKPVKIPQQNHFYVLMAFVFVVSGVLIYNTYLNRDQDKLDAEFYRNHIMTLQLIDFWKLSEEQLQAEQKDKEKKILDQGQHHISRQQLGHNSWTLLHMVTGGFPEIIPESLAKKFNAFLILFGQMYPCKLCANHFMELLKNEGLFHGKTKQQLMIYLCNLHNKVNQRLNKPIHSCSNVYEQWNTCGCSQE